MRLLRNTLLILLVAGLATVSFAKKYSDAPAGQGTSTVGIGGDYASLSDASLDFNTTANTGSWTIEVLNDLTEASNVYFGNTVLDGNTVTLKPAAGVTANVTFTSNAVPNIPGNLVIGASSPANYMTLVPTKNFVIDGSNNGTKSFNLNLTTPSQSVSSTFVLHVLGSSDNFQIKNTNVNNNNIGSKASAAIRFSCVSTSPTVTAYPENVTIDNCSVINMAAYESAYGIEVGQFGKAPTKVAPTALTVTNNYIHTLNKGILLTLNAGANISGNKFQLDQTMNGNKENMCIQHASSNGLNGWTFNVTNNVMDHLYCNATGGQYNAGITAVYVYANNTGTYNFINNMISGYNYVPADVSKIKAGQIVMRGICYYGNTCDVNVINNSINFPQLDSSYMGKLLQSYSLAIGLTGTGYVKTFVCKNNILRLSQNTTNAILNWTNAAETYADYNVIYLENGAKAARYKGLYYDTFSAWTAASNQDLNGRVIDPMATTPDKWVSATDLHFTGAVAHPLIAAAPNALVTTDIDGETRNVTKPWPGCDEQISVPTSNTSVSATIQSVGETQFDTATYSDAGAIYCPVKLNVATLGGDASVQISAFDAKHPNAASNYFISRWFKIENADGNVQNSSLTLTYTDQDVIDAGVAENQLQFARWNGASWTYFVPTSQDVDNNTITLNNVTGFSDWTLSGPMGVPVELSDFITE